MLGNVDLSGLLQSTVDAQNPDKVEARKIARGLLLEPMQARLESMQDRHDRREARYLAAVADGTLDPVTMNSKLARSEELIVAYQEYLRDLLRP
jgi:hypothetical protein